MSRRTHAARVRQRGQIAPFLLFGVLLASATMVMMFNTGQKVTDKSVAVNAADAAAYSGAVWAARRLNFMAYTNRAMVANHVAVGHFVSYVSWMRYVDDSIDHVHQVAQFIPYVGQYVTHARGAAEQVRALAEESAELAVPAIDAWNGNLRAAQLEAHASLALGSLNDLMTATARAWDPDLRINDPVEIAAMPDELRTLIETQLMARLAATASFVQRYTPATDQGAVSELISASLRTSGDTQRWISGERGWRVDLIAKQIRKLGRTTTTQSASGADWRASDQLQHRSRRLFGWGRWRRIGDRTSGASATEFDSDYAGVPAYYNVAGAPGDRSLHIVAVATKRQTDVRTANLMGMSAAREPIAAAAVARVEFRRPSGGAFASLGEGRREYSHLFNQFWEARLAPLDLGIGI
jgi:hypothetical protein